MSDFQTTSLPQTLPALLRQRAQERGDDLLILLAEDRGGEVPLSYRAVWELAQEAAAAFQALGLKPGDRVMLGLPTGIDFLKAFFGISLAGAVPVPFYPPARTKGVEDYEANLAALIGKAEPRLVLAMDRARLVTESAALRAGSRALVMTPDALKPGAAYVAPPDDPKALALIQFTSGSTRAPRGVMLTHEGLIANMAAFLEAIEVGPEDRTVSWLPLYHDMGLIGTLLMSLCAGTPIMLMSPQVFLLDVKRWLWAIHRFRATISVAPNFAYQLILNRAIDAQLEGLDLSSWRLAACGAEPILPGTLEAFAQRLEPYGFDARALTPVYGMAEVAVAATAPPMGRGMHVDRIAGENLETSGEALPLEAGEAAAIGGRETQVVSVGRALPGYRMRIATPEGQALPERMTGEIQLQGPSVMAGYLGDAEATEAAFVDGWLRTGDVGYMVGDEAYIVGRKKDLILKGGRNYAPQDFEALATEVEGVRQGCVAAFGISDPETGTERIVVLAETRAPEAEHAALARAIASRISQALGIQPDEVRLVEPGVLPKTSSGKIQRDKARQNWLQGGLKAPAEPGLLTKTRIVGRAMAQRVAARLTPAERDDQDA
ncbi:Long-chain-fatty-acid--AMP ligase FadD26 [compost metagenome]